VDGLEARGFVDCSAVRTFGSALSLAVRTLTRAWNLFGVVVSLPEAARPAVDFNVELPKAPNFEKTIFGFLL